MDNTSTPKTPIKPAATPVPANNDVKPSAPPLGAAQPTSVAPQPKPVVGSIQGPNPAQTPNTIATKSEPVTKPPLTGADLLAAAAREHALNEPQPNPDGRTKAVVGKSKGKGIIIVLVVVLLLAAGGAGTYLYMQSKDSKESRTSTNASQSTPSKAAESVSTDVTNKGIEEDIGSIDDSKDYATTDLSEGSLGLQ